MTATRLFNGTVQTGSGFAGYGHRTDIYTKTGVDVASTVGFACFVNSLSTNSSGPATNNNTNQTAILANASAQSTTASAPVTAINAIASSAYTGTVWQPVVGVEVDISVANPPGFFGEASKSAGIGFSVVLSGNSTYSASTAFGCDTSKGGFGWLNGVVLSGCVNTGLVIARNTVTPTIGVWVSAATTYGIYVGAKNLSPLNPGNVPAFDANHNPAIGIALGQTGATTAPSNILRFVSTSVAGAEVNCDISTDYLGSLNIAYNGTQKLSLTSSGALALTNSVLINGLQVVNTRITGYTPFTGTVDKAAALDTSTATLAQLIARVAALQQSLTTHGLIGA